MQKVRGWQLIVALVAIAGIGVFIALRWIGSGPRDAVGMTAYLPKREAALVFVDVAGVRNSGLLDKLLGSTIGEEAEYKTFVQRTGFDYKRDLDTALMSSASGIHYFLLKGRFDWNKLRAYASQEGGKCDGEYCHVSGSTPGRIISFYPITDDVMALASAATGNAARDIARHSAEKLPFDIPGQPVWLYAPPAVLRDQQTLPSGTRMFLKALEPAEHAVVTVGPVGGDAFELTINVTCRTEQEAAIMKAQLEGLTTLLSKFIVRENKTPNPADLSGVLTSGTFERDLRQVKGRWPLPKAFLESLSAN